MSKPFDYSKWDKIELSDDEEDVHPNIDKESWFRMKHRSRVEREEKEAQEIKEIDAAMEKANQRIQVVKHDIKKLENLLQSKKCDDDDYEDDDDFDDTEGLKAELEELMKANELRQKRLQEIEKNKKWNVDNICEVKEERTIVNANIVKDNYTPSGYAAAKEDLTPKVEVSNCQKELEKPLKNVASSTSTVPSKAPVASPSPPVAKKDEISSSFDTYHEFTVKYSEIVEEFMKMESLEASKEYLLKYGDILLQENASNYLLLASLEDEMNGYREKMKLTCRQSQMISNIAELAKSMHTHPGNVIIPFFKRMEQKELLEGFMLGVDEFAKKIIARAVTKREEMDRERKEQEIARAHEEGTDLESIPKEERLGPGGLDPLEVIETLPAVMQEAFESRDVEKLKEALLSMDPGEAQYHMKRCVDSGLWCDNS